MLEPFGEKNKNPIFVYKNLKIDSIRALSEGKHLKLTLKDDNLLINANYIPEKYVTSLISNLKASLLSISS